MARTGAITLVKRFTYRGAPEEWSNKYSFEGTLPVDAAAWKTLADAIFNAEKPCIPTSHVLVRAYGYAGTSNLSVAQIDYTLPPHAPPPAGTLAAAGTPQAGDAAAVVRWFTGRTNSRGKKIYCWKYFHGVSAVSGDVDALHATQRTALGVYAAKMIDGTLPGGVVYCAPDDANLSAPYVLPFITTRTLKRRGKRPPS